MSTNANIQHIGKTTILVLSFRFVAVKFAQFFSDFSRKDYDIGSGQRKFYPYTFILVHG